VAEFGGVAGAVPPVLAGGVVGAGICAGAGAGAAEAPAWIGLPSAVECRLHQAAEPMTRAFS
jgi:hypothetical protein